jgi:hypothetical protein
VKWKKYQRKRRNRRSGRVNRIPNEASEYVHFVFRSVCRGSNEVKAGLIINSPETELSVLAGYSLADFSTLKMEAIRSSETSVHTRSTWRHIPEDCILYTKLHTRD